MSEVKELLLYTEAIPHADQRYETCGDWQFLPNGLHVNVSDTGNWTSNMLVAIHEIVEAMLCRANGVGQESVDRFDMDYETNRSESSLEEPGDEPSAPYHRQHRVADLVERMVALQAGVNWEEHVARIKAL